MLSQSDFKRPTCPNCSKPTAICLCVRIQAPSIDNKIHVTILQHSLERNHPLNSARIARIGLRNVGLVTVFDVNDLARFEIRVAEERTPDACGNDSGFGGVDGIHCNYDCCGRSRSEGFVECGMNANNTGIVGNRSGGERCSLCWDPFFSERSVSLGKQHGVKDSDRDLLDESREVDHENRCNDDVLSIIIEKHGRINSIFQLPELNKKGIEQLLASPLACEVLGKGFVVKKFTKQHDSGKMQFKEHEEFEIRIHAGSAALFPGSNSFGAESVSFEVRNLIVLDGTWAKAKRIYNENPWLRLLPCIRLDVDKPSLFSGVRRQPKPGYISTIESIVYAMETLGGDNLEGLYNLLDVFDSMVNDQRRLKEERLRKASS